MRLSLASRPFDPTSRWVTSWLLSPLVLFAFRAVFALYAWFTIFFTLGWDGTHGDRKAGRNFSYFTVLTYWGIAGYGLFAAIHTGTYWLKGREALKDWGVVLQTLHEVLYSTITVYPWIVTIVFWTLLYSSFETPFATWSNTSQHALNAVYALLEIIIPRTSPLPWWHLIPIIILLALYLGLAYLTHATQGFYVYDFLDIQEHGSGITAGYIIGILVGACVIFIIVKYLIWLRVWVTESKLCRTGKFSARDKETALGMSSERLDMHAVELKDVRQV
ncbi:hypothetical protein EJ05DRAFT_76461 [Pseudovirgaria hyperparasitica]|uniref:FAR-17a/AIG1-like protein n=1 Tax=Pseudovirgaria hyperparasitica TaxID=470096 RepID=A0A6A6W2H2_9PEZI|nr:uncharacterized protein EJ05DRAFT_76461 [Pseudovirgaria hyperparasitica]KAF2756755.1 hypothetical protein EJ05DRAFT_76461 [Pseudovirgaria hyperparasitica]